MDRYRRLVRAALLTALPLAACSSGGVAGGPAAVPTLATAPPSTTLAAIDLCQLLEGVAADADRVDERAPAGELEASLQGVAAFSATGPTVAPPEVATEVVIVAGLYGALVAGLEASAWDWAAFTESDHAVRVADLRSDPATTAALEHVAAWSGEHC